MNYEKYLSLEKTPADIGPQDWDKLVYRGVGTESLRNLVDVFITERTVHWWDIRSPFDSQAGLSPECVPINVERFPQRPRWWSFRAEAGFSLLPLRYRFELTKPAPYAVDVVATEEHQYVEVGSKDDAQVTFRWDGETFVLLYVWKNKA